MWICSLYGSANNPRGGGGGGWSGGGGGGTRPKLGYNDRHKLKIWTLRDLTTSEKGF